MKIKNILKKINEKIYQYSIYNDKYIHKKTEDSNIEVSIAMTCFNQLDYTINGLKSLIQNTHNTYNIKYKFYLLDDCSADNTYKEFNDKKNLIYYREKKQLGVNNLWNIACELTKKSDFLIITNNDVKYSKDWANRLINQMIKNKAVAAGPITNAPGNRNKQNVRQYLNDYDASDKDKDIALISSKLNNFPSFHYYTLNGFCMAFNMRWLNTLDKPIINSPDANFAGEELFFKKYPCNPLIVPSSFIFHYKQVSVSRNDWEDQHFRKNNG